LPPADPDEWDSEAFTAIEFDALLEFAQAKNMTAMEWLPDLARTSSKASAVAVKKQAAKKKAAARKKRMAINATHRRSLAGGRQTTLRSVVLIISPSRKVAAPRRSPTIARTRES